MYLVLFPVAVLVVSALMAIGLGARRYWALYLLNALWFLGVFAAAYFTLLAWWGGVHSENWAMYGVLFFVWPYTVFLTIVGGIEIALLWGETHPHAKRCRRLTILGIAVLLALSLSAIFIA